MAGPARPISGRPSFGPLAGRYRLIAYDQRGHGRSWNGTTNGFTLDALAADLRAVLDAAVPPGRRVVLVGHSMGAMAVVAFARRHHEVLAERVGAVVLASTGVRRLTPTAAFLGLPSVLDPMFQPLARTALTVPVPTGGANPVSQRVLRFIALSRSASPAQVDFCNRIVASCRPKTRAAWGAAIVGFDQYEALGALDVPTYVVVGTADRLTPVAHSRSIAKALPRLVSFTELPGVGHMTTVEAAGIVNNLIVDAVERAALGDGDVDAVERAALGSGALGSGGVGALGGGVPGRTAEPFTKRAD